MKLKNVITGKRWLLLLLIVVMSCNSARRRPALNMRATYSASDKNPLGLYVARQLLQMAFPSLEIVSNKKSFDDYYYNARYQQKNYHLNNDAYITITSQFYPNKKDLYAIADFVSKGNTMLIVSNSFDWEFLLKFHIETYALNPKLELSIYDMIETGVSMTDSSRFDSDQYRFFFYPLDNNISRPDSFKAQEIVAAHHRNAGGIIFQYGSGKMIVVNNAAALTNYFLLTKNNYQYLLNLLSYLPDQPENIIWDNYYYKIEYKNDDHFSSFQELMKYPALRWAFWLTLLGSLLLIATGLIRKQKAIPVIKSNTNNSVEFVETMARLYLLKKDNKNIAGKMITYFLEHVRSKYYIHTAVLNNEFVQLLTAKSGVPLHTTAELIKMIADIQQQESISDHSLLKLNEYLQRFLKSKNI